MRPPINGDMVLTQLFGGNQYNEAYTLVSGAPIDGHPAIDIACPIGTPLYAPFPGRLNYHEPDPDFPGLSAIITNRQGDWVRLGHLSARVLPEGSAVMPHEVVALSGNSGISTGPHLHFEWHPWGESIWNGYGGALCPLGHFDRDVLTHLKVDGV